MHFNDMITSSEANYAKFLRLIDHPQLFTLKDNNQLRTLVEMVFWDEPCFTSLEAFIEALKLEPGMRGEGWRLALNQYAIRVLMLKANHLTSLDELILVINLAAKKRQRGEMKAELVRVFPDVVELIFSQNVSAKDVPLSVILMAHYQAVEDKAFYHSLLAAIIDKEKKTLRQAPLTASFSLPASEIFTMAIANVEAGLLNDGYQHLGGVLDIYSKVFRHYGQMIPEHIDDALLKIARVIPEGLLRFRPQMLQALYQAIPLWVDKIMPRTPWSPSFVPMRKQSPLSCLIDLMFEYRQQHDMFQLCFNLTQTLIASGLYPLNIIDWGKRCSATCSQAALLFRAIELGNTALVELMFSHGARMLFKNTLGLTVLDMVYQALEQSELSLSPAMFRLIIQKHNSELVHAQSTSGLLEYYQSIAPDGETDLLYYRLVQHVAIPTHHTLILGSENIIGNTIKTGGYIQSLLITGNNAYYPTKAHQTNTNAEHLLSLLEREHEPALQAHIENPFIRQCLLELQHVANPLMVLHILKPLCQFFDVYRLARHYRGGNCETFVAVKVVNLIKALANGQLESIRRLEVINVGFGQHYYVVINRQVNTPMTNPNTWGEDCFVIDSYNTFICRADNFIRQFGHFFIGRDNHAQCDMPLSACSAADLSALLKAAEYLYQYQLANSDSVALNDICRGDMIAPVTFNQAVSPLKLREALQEKQSAVARLQAVCQLLNSMSACIEGELQINR